MKKHSLAKVLSVLLLLVVITTYFVNGREGNINYLALGDVFINYIQSFYYFFDVIIFILVVGGFYGLLNKVKAYKKLIDGIAKRFSGNGKKFVIIATIVFALLASLTGLNIVLLIFIPCVVSIILLLGYDKLVALSATVGATIVGFIGGIFTTVRTSAGFSSFESFVGLDGKWDNLVIRILLLVVAVVLLVLYICKYMKKVDGGDIDSDISGSDPLLIETKGRDGKVVKVKYDDVKVWPFITIISIMLILLILGMIPWNGLFGIDVFEKFHTWITGLSIGKYAVFTSLISSNIPAFGEWPSMGNYMMPIVVIALFSLIIKFVYKIKLDSVLDAYVVGIKKMIPAVMVAGLAYAILVCSYNNGFIETIISNASEKFSDNVVIHSLIAILGSILNVDLYYVSSGVFSSIVSGLSDGANLKVYAIAFQSLYGLISLISPTSVLLIVGLSYLDVPYTKWIKYIWRFILELFILIFVVMMIVALI